MTVKLLTEHHLEFLSLTGGCTGSSDFHSCQNTRLLEITCRSQCTLTCNSFSGVCTSGLYGPLVFDLDLVLTALSRINLRTLDIFLAF